MTLTKCIEYWLNTLLSSLSKFLTDTYWLLLGKHTHLLVWEAIILKQSKVFIRLIYPTHSSVKKFFMPPPLGAGGIMFSGSPSVLPSARILNYPLLTCTWVRWSIRPTVTVLQYVRPSVCPSSVCPSVHPSREVSGHLPENAWREWPEILHVDVSWPSSELVSLWPRSVDFSHFSAILT